MDKLSDPEVGHLLEKYCKGDVPPLRNKPDTEASMHICDNDDND